MTSPDKMMRSFFYSCLKRDTLNSKSTRLLASNKMKSGINVGKLEGVRREGWCERILLTKKMYFFFCFNKEKIRLF